MLSLLHGGVGLPVKLGAHSEQAGRKLTESKTLCDFTAAHCILFYMKVTGSGFYTVLLVSAEKGTWSHMSI